jgi:RimJ/RimL family protein N-acetyltransferase
LPLIETERFLLRPFVTDDVDELHRLWNDPDQLRFIRPGWTPPREQIEALVERVNKLWAEKGFGQLAVVPLAEGKLVGYCGFKFLDDTDEVELLYGVWKAYWGQGITTETARACLRYAFEETGLERVVAVASAGNVGSWRVMEKVGMRYEKIARYYETDLKYYVIERESYRPDDATYTLRKD